MGADLDSAVRVAAFNFLKEQSALHGGSVLPRSVLAQGFEFDGRRVPLVGPQGIFKPAICELPLSITTVPGIKNAFFGGDGIFLASLTGPGRVWLQSMTMQHLAHAIQEYLPRTGETGAAGIAMNILSGG